MFYDGNIKNKNSFFFFCLNLFDTRHVNYLNKEYHFFTIRSNNTFDKIILKGLELDYFVLIKMLSNYRV